MALDDVSPWRKLVERSGRNTGAPVEALAVDGGTIRSAGRLVKDRDAVAVKQEAGFSVEAPPVDPLRGGVRMEKKITLGIPGKPVGTDKPLDPALHGPRRRHAIEGGNRPPGPQPHAWFQPRRRHGADLAVVQSCIGPLRLDAGNDPARFAASGSNRITALRSATISRPERARPMLHTSLSKAHQT